ncbi:hypothetical protein [Candidatus Alkanophaga liquidiphilum]
MIDRRQNDIVHEVDTGVLMAVSARHGNKYALDIIPNSSNPCWLSVGVFVTKFRHVTAAVFIDYGGVLEELLPGSTKMCSVASKKLQAV